MKIAYTSVAIDIFHYGHLRLLNQAKEVSDYHICGLYTDELCLKWNGNLVMKYEERNSILGALSCVDEVAKQANFDPTENLKIIRENFPQAELIFFQGHQNWKGMPGTKYIKSIGGKIIKPDFYSKLTRSSIRNKLNNTKKNQAHDIESYTLGDVSYFPLYNSTKANTLASLKPHLEKSLIEELFIITKEQWEKSPSDILKTVSKKFKNKIVVRSSSRIEDSYASTFAGFFHSELNVNSQNYKHISSAISNVINSYSKHDNASQNDQILIQSQTLDVEYSGVVFTKNMQNNGPYYLINYDKSSSTDTVTSGRVGNKIEIIKNVNSKNLPLPWKSLIESVIEIEDSLHGIALDIEFAINKKGQVIIFQVRTIAAIQKHKDIPEEKIYDSVKQVIKDYKNFSKNSILPSKYTLSDMSFWNPAEIIGDRSGNLAYSIHRFLILNRAWNTGLVPLGYKKIDRDLVVRIANKPYIEVETSFAALLPGNLDESISKKLIIYYQKKLSENPELHDKIEFEIVHNCFSPTSCDQLKELKKVLTKTELETFKNCLVKLTQNIFNNYNKIKNIDLKSLDKLKAKRNKLFDNDKLLIQDKIFTALELLNDAHELATPQFARMARLAFIGNQYLRGLVAKNVITNEASESFLSNINTIATKLSKDFNRVIKKEISISDFNKVYGHLRPGTYDIEKLPYIKDQRYFSIDESLKSTDQNDVINQKINLDNKKHLSEFLKDFEVSTSSCQLLAFIEETTKFRESFKFEFTKNLSLALELLAEVGDEIGIDRSMLSHLSIESLRGISPSSGIREISDLWHSQIEGKKKNDQIFRYIALPSLIFNNADLEIIKSHTVRPNFITSSLVSGKLIDLDSIEDKNYNFLSGNIVLLEKADPGYDWIFSKGIKGLITKFGGAASHMAIRAAEFGIPAAIGCGENIFGDLKKRNLIELDCMNKKIIIIR